MPLDREEARRNFQNVSQGKRRKAHVELAEAKARLRRVDEDLDISPALGYLSRGDWQSALIALAPLALEEIKKEDLLVPLLTRGLPFVYQVFVTPRRGEGRGTSDEGVH